MLSGAEMRLEMKSEACLKEARRVIINPEKPQKPVPDGSNPGGQFF